MSAEMRMAIPEDLSVSRFIVKIMFRRSFDHETDCADTLYQEAENRSEKMNGYFNELSSVITAWDINHAPTIDAVPVVRCEDCVHWDGKDGQCPSQTTGDPYLDQKPAADAFCSQGERKKEQGDETLCDEGHW